MGRTRPIKREENAADISEPDVSGVGLVWNEDDCSSLQTSCCNDTFAAAARAVKQLVSEAHFE
jgi:hypothetical protein